MALLEVRFCGRAPFRTAHAGREAQSLIRLLIRTAGTGILEAAPASATLEPLSASRSEAHVFKLTPHMDPDGQVNGSPVVVKIAPRAEGEAERGNYDKFVRFSLPAACRPALLAYASSGNLSGLCYSFVGGCDGASLDTLTDNLQCRDVATLDLALGVICDATRGSWGGPHLIREESDIARRYLYRHFTGHRAAAKTEATLNACAARYFDARQKDGRWLIGAAEFPSPYAVLFATGRKRPYFSGIVHGDLNSDNILVAQDRKGVTLVDFRNTGRGHIYEDLVALEASIRINYAADTAFGDILETERRIALGQPTSGDDSYSASIQKIRDTATRCFGRRADDSTYHFAVAAIGLRLMQARDLSHVARARITASALWAAKALTGELSR